MNAVEHIFIFLLYHSIPSASVSSMELFNLLAFSVNNKLVKGLVV